MTKTSAMYSLFVILFCATMSWAQNAEVVGDVRNGNMTSAVNCTVSIGDKFAFTDVKGRFRIQNVPFGQYTLQVKKDNTVIKEQSVSIDRATITIPQIVLPNNACAD